MKQIDLGWIVFSLLISLIGFLTSINLVISLAIFIIYTSYYFIFARKRFKKYLVEIDRVHSCYHFINSFLVTLSVKESFEEAYESATRIENKSLQDVTNGLTNMTVYDRINYLRSYFNLAIYKMFINILDLYQDQGGNVLTIADNLIRECTRTEKTLTEAVTIGNKHLVEFILLWVMSFGIVLFMRFGISEFYMMMLKNQLFIFMLFVFFLICLGSIHLFVTRFTNLTIKEDNGQ